MNWRDRFTQPTIHEIEWAVDAPHRLGLVSSENGSTQAWWWDVATGERGVASSEGSGAEEVHIHPDGSGVVWWLDPTGDERGRWMITKFGDDAGQPLFPDLPYGWMMGISLGRARSAVGLADERGYSVYVDDRAGSRRLLYRHSRAAGVGREWPQGGGGLSADGTLLCIRHTEIGDLVHSALRVLDCATGDTVAEFSDEGNAVVPVAWSPVDHKLVVSREITGYERPWIWDLDDKSLQHVDPDLEGAVHAEAWYPDSRALLVRQDHEATDIMFRYDLGTGGLQRVGPESGTIASSGVRADGAVWYLHNSGILPPRVIDESGQEVLALPSGPPPTGRRREPFFFSGPSGDRIQGWLIRPDGDPPYPTVVSVHGGPEHHDTDSYDPRRLAYADAGLAVVLVNYRGSTGYGRAFRDTLRGNVGFPESADICAAVDHLVAAEIVNSDALILEGWSWGGYLATLNAGLNPERWRAVVAGIPVGDLISGHYECAPAVRQWETSIMGGDPMDQPHLYHERNPMTYVDNVTAPMLIIASENDSRCPLGQVMAYAHALRRLGKDITVHLYEGGHHANDTATQIAITEMIIDFLLAHVGESGSAVDVDSP